jgi:hypothetical protein
MIDDISPTPGSDAAAVAIFCCIVVVVFVVAIMLIANAPAFLWLFEAALFVIMGTVLLIGCTKKDRAFDSARDHWSD